MTSMTVARIQDPTLIDLVDTLVAAVDLDRGEEVARLREALEPFGASSLFDDEVRLSGTRSSELDTCCCEGWL